MEPDFAPKLRPNLGDGKPPGSRAQAGALGRKSLRRAVRNFARQLRADFPAEIERDPRGFRTRVLRLLRAALPVKSGRPRSEPVTRAAEMRAQGKSWRAIYAACIPLHVIGDSRILAQSRLRSAFRARRRRMNKFGRIKSRL